VTEAETEVTAKFTSDPRMRQGHGQKNKPQEGGKCGVLEHGGKRNETAMWNNSGKGLAFSLEADAGDRPKGSFQ
jgi:hypothetical protein